MEEIETDVPELPVRTEYVHRTSESSDSSIKITGSLEKGNSLDASEDLSLSSMRLGGHKSSREVASDVENSCNLKRNDSYTNFGHMETISLDASEQEGVNLLSQAMVTMTTDNSLLGSNTETVENRKIKTQSLIMRDGEAADTQKCVLQPPETEISISKYFSPEVSLPTHCSGEEFFNALPSASGDAINKDHSAKETIDIGNKSKGIIGNVNQYPGKNAERAEEVFESSMLTAELDSEGTEAIIKKEEKPTDQPTLLKFFAEDKSGTDTKGKAFFDKIAAEKNENPFLFVSKHSTICSAESAFDFPYSKEPVVSPNPLSKPPSDSSFLSSLGSAGDDEMYEAWLPSEYTRQTLVAMVTSEPGSYFPEKDQLTMPSLVFDEEMDDPLKFLLSEANSPMAQYRKVLTANDVTANEEGLRNLIEAECYHAAINLTTRLLKTCEQGPSDFGHLTRHTPLSLQLWFTRIALFVKLKKFSFAEVESEAFGNLDKPDLYYEFYRDLHCGKKGTMVPFSFRLLLAELSQYQGNHQIALDNLYRILTIVQKIISNLQSGYAEDGSMIELSDARCKGSLELWQQRECRVLYSILNCVLSQKDYVMTVSVAQILLEKDKEHSPQLHSALGRIYLQLGDMKRAQDCFNKVGLKETFYVETNIQVEQLINKALLAIAHNDNEEAYKLYEQAYILQPQNPMLANNMAVCLLYMGRLKESLSLLEQTVQKNPRACLHDGILFNICTLYELESSRSTLKKYAMLDLVSNHAGDSFNISCLKMQNSKG